MRSLNAITSSVVRAENNVRRVPDRLSPGGVVRSGYETTTGMAHVIPRVGVRERTERRFAFLSVYARA